VAEQNHLKSAASGDERGSVEELAAPPAEPGVALLGMTKPIPAGTTIVTGQHLIIDDDTPARPLIEDAIRNLSEIAFIVVVTPRIDAGGAMPAGVIRVNVYPSVVVNFLD
jgi:hypothetical protein